MSKNGEDLSDDFVASILSKEASEKNIRYSAFGLQAFLPKRSTTNAPKPNTRFLRNIVRKADSHNAALLAKEAEEAKERLRILHLKERAKRREAVGANGVGGGGEKPRAAQRPDRQIYRVGAKREVPTTRASVQNRVDRGEREKERKRRRSQSREGRDDERGRSTGAEREKRQRRRSGERKRDRSREYKRSISDDRKRNDSNRYHRHHSSRHHSSKNIDGSRHSHRSRSRSRSRSHERGTDKSKSKSTSTSHRSDKKDRSSDTNTKPYLLRPRSPRRRPDESDADRERRRKRRKEMEMVEESDHPSSASTDSPTSIIGPAPPPARARGRGTMSGSSAMDARFSEQYDPAMDVRPDHDGEGDDWDSAIEAFRDRQKWKALGAERLRSAGFGEDFITAWENNDTKNTANVKWAKGEREWDRGKVIEEGEVKVRAIWAKD